MPEFTLTSALYNCCYQPRPTCWPLSTYNLQNTLLVWPCHGKCTHFYHYKHTEKCLWRMAADVQFRIAQTNLKGKEDLFALEIILNCVNIEISNRTIAIVFCINMLFVYYTCFILLSFRCLQTPAPRLIYEVTGQNQISWYFLPNTSISILQQYCRDDYWCFHKIFTQWDFW